MRPRVDFWKSVFTEMGRNDIALIAKDVPSIVFRRFEAPGLSDPPTDAERRARRAVVERERNALTATLQRLEKTRAPQDEEERKLLEKLDQLRASPDRPPGRPLTAIAAQNGIRERLLEGLVRFEPFAERMRDIFRQKPLAEELTIIPLFESYFNLSAVSSKQATGPWQFLHGFASKFRLRMDHVLDERRDPIRSSEAAATAFVDALKAWEKILGDPKAALPFAIVEHNVGRPILRAAQQGKRLSDIEQFVTSYRSKLVDYAAPNYYPEFLAMNEVYRDRHLHFPELTGVTFEKLTHRELPRSVELRTVVKVTGLPEEEIRRLNPALQKRSAVFPKGALLHLPEEKMPHVESWLTSEAERERLLKEKQRRSAPTKR